MYKTTSILWKLGILPAIVFALTLPWNARADDHLDSLRIGSTVFTNVTVLTKTSSDIFFKHSYGFGNTKIRELDRATLLSLGYQLPPDESEKVSVFNKSAQSVLESPAVTNLVSDPRVQEAQALIADRMRDWVEAVTPQVIYSTVAGIILVYLFFCFCCRQICVKTQKHPSPLIWLPILKQFPLLRAANMSGWWMVPAILLFPLGWPVMKIVWAFKIGPARGKGWFIGLLLLLPVTNVLAFLYLAFSGTGAAEPASSVISLGAPPARRAAA